MLGIDCRLSEQPRPSEKNKEMEKCVFLADKLDSL